MITAAGEVWLAEAEAEAAVELRAELVRLDDLTADTHHTAEEHAALRQAIAATPGGVEWLAEHDRGIVEWYDLDFREPGEPSLTYDRIVSGVMA